jgi:putative sporulation protein YtxC
MASRLTIVCSDEAEAETLCALLDSRLEEGGRRGICRLTRCRHVVEAGGREDGQPDPPPETDRALTQAAAEAVAALIVGHLEPRLVTRAIVGRVMDMCPEELEDVKGICFRMLNGPENAGPGDGGDSPAAVRRANLVRRIASHFRECTHLDVGGFLRFRLADYREYLADTVNLALEEYAADRQYREFISLLQYFVHFQEAKIPRANVIHCGGNRYAMLDHRMQPLKWSGGDAVTVEKVDRELNCEDMIVSTLIAASPEHIIIHTREPDTPSIRTIRQIFEGRTTLCARCSVCESVTEREGEIRRT